MKSDVRIGVTELAVSPEPGQVQKLTLFSENFIRRYLKSLGDARSTQVAGILLLAYQYEPTDTSNLMRYLQQLVSLIPEASADALNFLAIHVQLP